MSKLATPGQQGYLRGYALRAPISADLRRRILRLVNDRLTLADFVQHLTLLRNAEALLEQRATPVEAFPGPPADPTPQPRLGTPVVRTPDEAVRAERYFHRIKCEAQRDRATPRPLGHCDECGAKRPLTTTTDEEIAAIFDIDTTTKLCDHCMPITAAT